jgi:hypothetical protein
MCRTRAGEALGLCFHHGLEGVAIKRALLLQTRADGVESVVRQCFAQQRLISDGTFGFCGA